MVSSRSGRPDELDKLTKRIQEAGTEVVEAKAGAGSATLSMAYAAARFAESVLRGLAGEKDVVECAFVASTVEPSLAFFSSKVKLGKNGAEEVYPVGAMTEYEKGWCAGGGPARERVVVACCVPDRFLSLNGVCSL